MSMRPSKDNTKASDWYSQNPWVIVRSEPQREDTFTAHCIARGICAYNPKIKVQKPRPGRKTKTEFEPLFRGYVFVMDDERHWRTIRTLPGFLNWLHIAGPSSPVASVEASAIAALGEQEFNLSTRLKTGWTPFSVGQSVRFVGGPFEGLLAKISAIDTDKRISVLRDLFGRETIVKVHASEIDAA